MGIANSRTKYTTLSDAFDIMNAADSLLQEVGNLDMLATTNNDDVDNNGDQEALANGDNIVLNGATSKIPQGSREPKLSRYRSIGS